MQRVTVVGIDQSARGTAAIALDNGKFAGQVFFADTKTDAATLKGAGAVESIAVKAGDDLGRVVRLDQILEVLSIFFSEFKPDFVAFEDYALARQAFSHSLGEVGAVVRLAAYWAGIPFRVYDIQGIKIFATGRGDAEKADMIIACRSKWDQIDFMRFGKETGAAGNLADAYVISQLLWTEIRLREGDLRLDELEDHEHRVFNRTTKQRPLSLLDMSFAVKG